jgi:hypothetical protein
MTKYSATEMKKKFSELATATFKYRREGVLTIFDPLQITSKMFMLLRIWESIYASNPLKNGLIRLFGENLNLYSSARVQQQQRSTRVAVTSTKDTAANRCLITNYNRRDFSGGDDFEREDEDEKEMKVWEAGLATAAAPFYFSPFEKTETNKNYVDGALHANLPIQYALDEMANLWPKTDTETSLDALVSIGTGIQKKELVIPKILEIGGFKQICTNFHNNINTERLWDMLMNNFSYSTEIRNRIHRLNAHITGDYIALDDHKKMAAMEEMVALQMEEIAGRPSPLAMNVANVADILTASLFFFEPDASSFVDKNLEGSSVAGRYELNGSIRCRLAQGSQELKRLLNIVDGFWQREIKKSAPSMASMSLEDHHWSRIELQDNSRNGVRTGGAWFSVDCTISTYEPTEMQQIIAVSLCPPREEEKYYSYHPLPISGFPITFKELKKKALSA